MSITWLPLDLKKGGIPLILYLIEFSVVLSFNDVMQIKVRMQWKCASIDNWAGLPQL